MKPQKQKLNNMLLVAILRSCILAKLEEGQVTLMDEDENFQMFKQRSRFMFKSILTYFCWWGGGFVPDCLPGGPVGFVSVDSGAAGI